jgi:hypothetical protein
MRRFTSAGKEFGVYYGDLGISAFPFTISAWVTPQTAIGAFNPVVMLGGGIYDNEAWLDYTTTGFRAPLTVSGGPNEIATSTTVPTLGTRVHLVGVFASPVVKLYVNGVNEGNSPGTVDISTFFGGGPKRIQVGQYTWAPQYPPNADIAEVAFWNAGLTADEIIALSKGFAANLVRPSALRGYWHFRQPTLTIADSAATPPSAPTLTTDYGGSLPGGAYGYKISFVGPDGESALGTAASVTVINLSPTGGNDSGVVDNPFGSGSLDDGARYDYQYTFLETATGRHSLPSPKFGNTLSSGKTSMMVSKGMLTAPPTGCRRFWYRSAGNEAGRVTHPVQSSFDNPSVPDAFFTFDDGTFLRDVRHDSELDSSVVVPTTDTLSKNKINLTGIPTGPTGTVARKIYRTTVGGSTYLYLGSIEDNTTTSFVDNTADSALGLTFVSPKNSEISEIGLPANAALHYSYATPSLIDHIPLVFARGSVRYGRRSAVSLVGSSTGAATVTGQSAVIINTQGSSVGTADVIGVGAEIAWQGTSRLYTARVGRFRLNSALDVGESIGSSIGSGVATGASAFDVAHAETVGSSVGLSAVDGRTAPVGTASGVAEGVALVVGAGYAESPGFGEVVGVATVIGRSGAIIQTAGTSFGSAVVLGGSGTFQVTEQIILVGGQQKRFRHASLSIRDYLGGQPNIMTGRVSEFKPDVGQEVKIGIGSTSPANLVFGGHIQRSTQTSEELKENVAWDITAVSYEWLLGKRFVNRKYVGVSVTVIVQDLFTRYAPEFTLFHLEAALPLSPEISFENQRLTDCLDTLSNAIGTGEWFVDATRDLHFGYLLAEGYASEIDLGYEEGFTNLQHDVDLSQVKNRIVVVCNGSQVATPVDPGSTVLPVEDETVFLASTTGRVKVGAHEYISYTGVIPGKLTTIAGAPVPSSGGSVSLASVAGMVLGPVSYKVTFKNDLGETLPGIKSSTITAPSWPIPSGPPSPSDGGFGRLVGSFFYLMTNVTQYGETSGSSGSTFVAAAHAAPSAPILSSAGIGGLIGTYGYALSSVTQYGESTLSAAQLITHSQVAAPTAAPGISATGVAGNLQAGMTYFWKYTWITALGETTAGPGAGMTIGGSPTGANVNISNAPSSSIIRARVYRTKGGTSGPYYAIAETPVSQFTSTTIVDNVVDSSLSTQEPSANTAGGGSTNVSVPVGPTGTSSRRVYRTAPGGSDYRLVAEVEGNSTTSVVDNTPSSSRGEASRPTNTAGGKQATLFVPVSISGTLARRIYRARSSGGPYLLLGEIKDNFTTGFTDNKVDTELGVQSPSFSTAGGSAIFLSSIPVGPSYVKTRRIYRSKSGDPSNWYFVTEIGDNITTSFTDVKADADLGDVILEEATLGVDIGETSLRVTDVSAFQPGGGWAFVGSERIHYTGISGNSLTGIPASGDNSIQATHKAGSEILAPALLTGIPTSGNGSILYALTDGDSVNVLVTVQDTASQSTMAGLIGYGDGIFEEIIEDTSASEVEAIARANAKLSEIKDPIVTVKFDTRDMGARTGRSVVLNLPDPTNISGTFKIQNVTIELGAEAPAAQLFPRRQVEASSRRFSFEQLLRLITTA